MSNFREDINYVISKTGSNKIIFHLSKKKAANFLPNMNLSIYINPRKTNCAPEAP